MRRATTKPGAHGTLYLYEIIYTDPSEPGMGRMSTRMWAYNLEHVEQKFYDSGDGWEIISIARVPEGGGSTHRAARHHFAGEARTDRLSDTELYMLRLIDGRPQFGGARRGRGKPSSRAEGDRVIEDLFRRGLIAPERSRHTQLGYSATQAGIAAMDADEEEAEERRKENIRKKPGIWRDRPYQPPAGWQRKTIRDVVPFMGGAQKTRVEFDDGATVMVYGGHGVGVYYTDIARDAEHRQLGADASQEYQYAALRAVLEGVDARFTISDRGTIDAVTVDWN